METLELIISITGVGGIISGIVIAYISRNERRRDAREVEREDARIEETRLIFQGLKAVGSLTDATALAVEKGHTNGEMAEARGHYKDFKRNLNNYFTDQSIKRNHGK